MFGNWNNNTNFGSSNFGSSNFDKTSSNGFSVSVSNSTIKYVDSHKYYALRHEDEYKIILKNDNTTQCDANVWVDGTLVGVWRLKPYSSAQIERPANENRKFTFFKENSKSAQSVGIVAGASQNGVIKVVFKPELRVNTTFSNSNYESDCFGSNEKRRTSKCKSSTSYSSMSNRGVSFGREVEDNDCMMEGCMPQSASLSNSTLSAGATGLGQHSNQYFSSTSALSNIDTNNVTTIEIRLVVDGASPQYVPLKEYEPKYNIFAPPRI